VLAQTAALDPTDMRHFLNAGGILQQMGRLQEASVQFERATQAEPDSPLPLLHLAEITADPAAAIATLRKAVALRGQAPIDSAEAARAASLLGAKLHDVGVLEVCRPTS
jgi:Tfp pilus assembly protein PilF